MTENGSLLDRAKAELEQDLREPYSTSPLAKASGMTEEEWNQAKRAGEALAEQSAIWSLKLRTLQYFKSNPTRKGRKINWPILVTAAVIGGIAFSYIGTTADTYQLQYDDFLDYRTGEFMLWFSSGCVIVAALFGSILRLPSDECLNAGIAGIAGTLFAVLVGYGPGQRGTLYWLAHGGVVRLTLGAVVALLVFEVWRRQKKNG